MPTPTNTGTALFPAPKTIAFATLSLAFMAGQPAWSQADTYRAASTVDLDATIDTSPMPATTQTVPLTGAALFNDPPVPDGGWQGLAKVLDALTPSVDTNIPLTPSQITDRIARIIDQGRYDEALSIIEQRKLQREQQNLMGADVQLMFLEGRALSESGQGKKAITVYQDMITHYPELPEPWNNLSAEYVRLNEYDMAAQALETALTIDPNYATARLNLGIVQLMQARQSFNHAARLGVSEAGELAKQTTQILQP